MVVLSGNVVSLSTLEAFGYDFGFLGTIFLHVSTMTTSQTARMSQSLQHRPTDLQ